MVIRNLAREPSLADRYISLQDIEPELPSRAGSQRRNRSRHFARGAANGELPGILHLLTRRALGAERRMLGRGDHYS